MLLLAVLALTAASCTSDNSIPEISTSTSAPSSTVPPATSTSTTAAPATTTTAPTTTTTNPPEVSLGEYLAALYELSGRFILTQADIAASSGGNPADFVDVLANQLRALQSLDPPPEAEEVQAVQEASIAALLAATEEFADALDEGGAGILDALDAYIDEAAAIAEEASAADDLLRTVSLPAITADDGPLPDYLSTVLTLQAGATAVQDRALGLFQAVDTDPEAALAELAGFADDLEELLEKWQTLVPPPAAEALHALQVDTLQGAAATFRAVEDLLDAGGSPSITLLGDLQRIGASGNRVAAGWSFLIADALSSDVRPLSGTYVTITGIGDTPAEKFSYRRALEPVEDELGVRIVYTGVEGGDFDARIAALVGSGAPPDVAIYENPGALIDRAGSDLVALPADVARTVAAAWPAGWLDIAAVGGSRYAVPTSSGIKSLVWYEPTRFRENGYEVPETWNDLLRLTDRMIEDGNTPWCVGIASGGSATGWTFTDWVEDVLLRFEPVEVYDEWIRHGIAFDDERIQAAWREVLFLWDTPGAVHASHGSIAASPWDASGELLAGRCMMFRQASFIADSLPEGVKIGPLGVEVFLLPGRTVAERPAVVTGEFAAAFRDAPEVWAVMAHLGSGVFTRSRHEALASRVGTPTGFLSANLDQDLSGYVGIERRLTEIMQEATVSRYDASDLMPAAVGNARSGTSERPPSSEKCRSTTHWPRSKRRGWRWRPRSSTSTRIWRRASRATTSPATSCSSWHRTALSNRPRASTVPADAAKTDPERVPVTTGARRTMLPVTTRCSMPCSSCVRPAT